MTNELNYQGKPIREWIDALTAGDATSQVLSAGVLGDFGEQVMSIVPLIRDALETMVLTATVPELRAAASEALVRIGPVAHSPVPVLIDNLQDEIPSVRWNSARALGEIGIDALNAIASLTGRALHDPNPRVRVESAVAIWRIDRRVHRVVPQLIEALKEHDEVIRWIAADCLGDVGTDAHEAIPALQAALQMPYKTRLIHIGIATALERISS